MRTVMNGFFGALTGMVVAAAAVAPAVAQDPIAIKSRFAEVNGTKLHYLILAFFAK